MKPTDLTLDNCIEYTSGVYKNTSKIGNRLEISKCKNSYFPNSIIEIFPLSEIYCSMGKHTVPWVYVIDNSNKNIVKVLLWTGITTSG